MRELRGCADCGRQNTSKVPRQGRPQKAGFGGCWRHPGLFQSAARGWNMLWTPCGSRGYLVAPPNPWFHTLQSYAACYAACKMLRIVVPVSTLSGHYGTDGCAGYDYPSDKPIPLPYAGGCTGAGGWRCINSMCVQSANATISKEICLAVCGATMSVASTKGMAVKGALSSGTVHIN